MAFYFSTIEPNSVLVADDSSHNNIPQMSCIFLLRKRIAAQDRVYQATGAINEAVEIMSDDGVRIRRGRSSSNLEFITAAGAVKRDGWSWLCFTLDEDLTSETARIYCAQSILGKLSEPTYGTSTNGSGTFIATTLKHIGANATATSLQFEGAMKLVIFFDNSKSGNKPYTLGQFQSIIDMLIINNLSLVGFPLPTDSVIAHDYGNELAKPGMTVFDFSQAGNVGITNSNLWQYPDPIIDDFREKLMKKVQGIAVGVSMSLRMTQEGLFVGSKR